jgi:hypothetical protein
VGKGIPTTQAWPVREGFFDFDHPQRVDGDGSVTVSNATPNFQSEVVFTGAEHVHLLEDPKVRSAIEAFFK